MSSVSVRLVHVIVAGAAAQGVAPPDVLAAASIDPADLAEPDHRVSRAVETRLWHEAARLTGDESFGLHLTERPLVGDFAGLLFAMRSSATLGAAYERMIRYLRLVVQGPALDLRIDGHVARLRHYPPAEAPAPARHAVECLIAGLVVLAKQCVDSAFSPRAVRFRHAAPADIGEHRRVLGPGVRFGEAHDELEIDRALLTAPLASADAALCEVLDDHLASRLAALPSGGSFLDRARAALAAELVHGEPALPAIAARLRLHPRTLQRRLQQEGTSLSSLLDRVRADLAVRYLSEPRASISDVACHLGFSEVSTFHRAFKRWTGVTPAAYRRARSRSSA